MGDDQRPTEGDNRQQGARERLHLATDVRVSRSWTWLADGLAACAAAATLAWWPDSAQKIDLACGRQYSAAWSKLANHVETKVRCCLLCLLNKSCELLWLLETRRTRNHLIYVLKYYWKCPFLAHMFSTELRHHDYKLYKLIVDSTFESKSCQWSK